jgi:hypothetical protein
MLASANEGVGVREGARAPWSPGHTGRNGGYSSWNEELSTWLAYRSAT